MMNITIDLVLTGANITRLQKAAGLTVHDIQAALGFNSPAAVYKWKAGHSMPSLDNLVVLAALLGVKIDDILVVRAVA